MKKVLITIIALSFPIISFSQIVPGYLGKRIVLDYQLQTMFTLNNPSADPNDEFGFNFRHFISVEFVAQKRFSWVADIGYSNGYLDEYRINDLTEPYGYYGGISLYTGDDFYKLTLSENLKFHTIHFGGGYRLYRKSLAPILWYSGFKFRYMRSVSEETFIPNAELWTSDGWEHNYSGTNADYTLPSVAANSFGIFYEWGQRSIIGDFISIDFGMTVGIQFSGWTLFDEDLYFDPSGEYYEDSEDYIKDGINFYMHHRLRKQNMFNIGIKVGLLP